jgi:hypothetical protein
VASAFKGHELMGVNQETIHDQEDQAQSAALSCHTSHIRRKFQYYENASLIKSSKGEVCERKGGGKRGKVNGFSKNSRRRLMRVIAKVRKDACLPNFVTLTYPNKFPTVDRAKRDLKVFLQRLVYSFPGCGYIWKLEPQERGAAHFHMMVWGIKENILFQWVVNNWFEIAGDGDPLHKLFHAGALKGSQPCVQAVRSWKGVWSYASKYLGKTFEQVGWKWSGRFWGVGNKNNIPFGELKEIEVSWRWVVRCMRYQRRFMHMHSGYAHNSLTTFCDASQWANRLISSL